MSPKEGLSVLELQYFKDEVYRIAQELKEIVEFNSQKSQNNSIDEEFKKAAFLFKDLAELASDLGATAFENYFSGFYEILNYAKIANNERANKKVLLMCMDYQELLLGLARDINDRDRLKGILKAFEVLTFKQDRLKRGEFFSLVKEQDYEHKKQRAV